MDNTARDAAFAIEINKVNYGDDETSQARAWFNDGWAAAVAAAGGEQPVGYVYKSSLPLKAGDSAELMGGVTSTDAETVPVYASPVAQGWQPIREALKRISTDTVLDSGRIRQLAKDALALLLEPPASLVTWELRHCREVLRGRRRAK